MEIMALISSFNNAIFQQVENCSFIPFFLTFARKYQFISIERILMYLLFTMYGLSGTTKYKNHNSIKINI